MLDARLAPKRKPKSRVVGWLAGEVLGAAVVVGIVGVALVLGIGVRIVGVGLVAQGDHEKQ